MVDPRDHKPNSLSGITGPDPDLTGLDSGYRWDYESVFRAEMVKRIWWWNWIHWLGWNGSKRPFCCKRSGSKSWFAQHCTYTNNKGMNCATCSELQGLLSRRYVVPNRDKSAQGSEMLAPKFQNCWCDNLAEMPPSYCYYIRRQVENGVTGSLKRPRLVAVPAKLSSVTSCLKKPRSARSYCCQLTWDCAHATVLRRGQLKSGQQRSLDQPGPAPPPLPPPHSTHQAQIGLIIMPALVKGITHKIQKLFCS